jgi:hypothetical protein
VQPRSFRELGDRFGDVGERLIVEVGQRHRHARVSVEQDEFKDETGFEQIARSGVGRSAMRCATDQIA